MASTILPRDYFERSTLEVAKSLLGKYLVRETKNGIQAGRIIEVEAYVGPHDLACHASKGRTKRTEVMFGVPGVAYVYMIYGMYHCFNIVTEREGYAAAVLVRGIELADSLQGANLISGPGRLCRFLEIDRSLTGWDLTAGKALWLEDRGEPVSARSVQRSPRIGVEYAGKWAKKPWRFFLKEGVKGYRVREVG
jgi:DNA-3-methyladenine glycosylase